MQVESSSAPVRDRMRDLLHRAMHLVGGPRPAVRIPGSYPVGVSDIALGSLTGAVWYPAAFGMQEEAQLYCRVYAGLAAARASMRSAF